MGLEKQISIIARKIYNKVITFINNNKCDDDIYYKYAYLKLNKGKQIIFDFNSMTLYVISDEKTVYDGFPSCETKIFDGNAEFCFNDVRFDTSLKSKVKKCQKETQRQYYENLLDNQQSLSADVKNSIVEYYNKLNKEVDYLQYNKTKTQSLDNFKEEVFDVYNDYMYEKEMSKLESNNDILPAVQVAVDRWAKIISDDTHTESIGNDSDSKILMTLVNTLFSTKSISEEQITIFKESLAKKIMNAIYENDGEVVQMKCDYGPDFLLYEAMKESGISIIRTPFKTNMYIRAYWVSVKRGYGAKDEILFDSTENEDIKNIKNRYYQLNNNVHDEKVGCNKVLKKM